MPVELGFYGGMFEAFGGFSVRIFSVAAPRFTHLFQREDRRMYLAGGRVAGLFRESQANLSPCLYASFGVLEPVFGYFKFEHVMTSKTSQGYPCYFHMNGYYPHGYFMDII